MPNGGKTTAIGDIIRRVKAMTISQFRTISHKTLAAFMTVWLSGVVFLFCCQEMNAAPTEAEFCPLAKVKAHCDKAAPASANVSFAATADAKTIDCCGFLPAMFDKARKIEQAQKQIALKAKPVPLKFALPFFANTPLEVSAFYSRMPDKQTTFIQNCVFRI